MDYWTDYFCRNPNAVDNDFDNPDFEADVAAMMAGDEPASVEPSNADAGWEIVDE